jgi:hypothetical protein
MEKGEFSGECNRTACNLGPATYYNHSTRKYYCCKCALKINQFNQDFYERHGYNLCTIETLKTENNDKSNSESIKN